jgi:hypothetical protein
MTDVPQPPSDEERTTDENDPGAENEPAAAPPPSSAPFSSAPADESPAAAATPASTAPVTDATTPATATSDTKLDDDADADADDGEDEEPLEATRLSPYAMGAFAVGLLSLFYAPQNIFQFGSQPIPTSQLLRFVLPQMLLPLLAAVVSLWLSFRAEEEIFVAGGRFGGVGLYRAARVVAIVTLVIVAAAIVVLTVLAEQPQPQQIPQFG